MKDVYLEAEAYFEPCETSMTAKNCELFSQKKSIIEV